MLLKSVFVLASALVASAASASDICIQGCCDLKLKLHGPILDLVSLDDESKAELTLPSSEIQCCPCDANSPVSTPTAHSVPSATNNPDGQRVCAQCIQCATDCICGPNHHSSCGAPEIIPVPDDPEGRRVCPQNLPCQGDCICKSALMADPGPPKTTDGLRVCPLGQPCSSDCLCRFDNIIGYLNPSDLGGLTIVCAEGKSEDSCISRKNLLDSMKAVLFPKAGTKIIDYKPKDGKYEKVKDEL